MANMLDGGLSRIAYKTLRKKFFPATLERDGDDGAVTSFQCLALDVDFSDYVRANSQGVIGANDRKIMVLALSLSTEPQTEDRVTLKRKAGDVGPFVVGQVAVDPARAVWTLQGKR